MLRGNHPSERKVLRGQIPLGRSHREGGEELHHHGGEIVAGALVERDGARALRDEGVRRALLLVALGREAAGVESLGRREDRIETALMDRRTSQACPAGWCSRRRGCSHFARPKLIGTFGAGPLHLVDHLHQVRHRAQLGRTYRPVGCVCEHFGAQAFAHLRGARGARAAQGQFGVDDQACEEGNGATRVRRSWRRAARPRPWRRRGCARGRRVGPAARSM